jgi:hypothetical protein
LKIRMTLTGTRPLLLNNARLANPLDPIVRALKPMLAKKRKTDEDLLAIMQIEARGGVYETDDGLLAIPTDNIWRSIKDAATMSRNGRDIERGLSFEEAMVSLLVNGETVRVDDFLTVENIDYRSAVISRRRIMVSRPIVRNWSCVADVEIIDEIIDLHSFKPILDRAGKFSRLGTYRTKFGSFVNEVEAL